MRIAVLGAGANGAAIGADLTRDGLDVTLIEQWPDHVAAMRERGVEVRTSGGSTVTAVDVVNVCQVAELRQPFDLVLMLMKAYDSVWAAHLIEPLLAPDGLLVGVQNGMTLDAIAGVVGPERTLGCVIEISSTMFEPGVVERHSDASRSWFAVGGTTPGTMGRADEVAAVLRRSGSADVVDDIRWAKWMKLVSNATTLVTTASLGLSMAEAERTPGMRELMVAAGQEALDAARADGAAVVPIFGLTDDEVSRPEGVVDTLLDTLYAGFILPHTTTTVLQDWRKGRRSEVRELNGHVVRTARRYGTRSAVNEAVTALADEIEAGTETPGSHNLPRLRAALAE
jgi:2-dehydropantoate 2-reductase